MHASRLCRNNARNFVLTRLEKESYTTASSYKKETENTSVKTFFTFTQVLEKFTMDGIKQ
jgi:hypothetical protein